MRSQHDHERIVIRPAVAADIDAFYGGRPYQTVRALTAFLDGCPVGVIGIARENGRTKLFSEYHPDLKGQLRSMCVLRAIKTVMQWMQQSPLPVVAIAQPEEADAPRLLKRMGFEFRGETEFGDFYEWLPS